MSKGQCVVCGIRGRSGRDFVCENCGDPNGIMLYCCRCKTRTPLTNDGLVAVEKQMGRTLERRTGVVLKNSSCADCSAHGEEVNTKIIALKTN